MCAAKKANEGSPSTNPGSRYLGPNPLPDGVVGPDLLVDLMTERAIDKCGIKENWEESGGWEFDDLRSIVACALGEGFAIDRDRERMAVVEKRTLVPLMKKIRENGAPSLVREDNTSLTLLPEVFYTALILGLFDSTNPLPVETKEWVEMRKEFAELMEVPEVKVKNRAFEHAKKVVMNRYQQHLERQKQRSEHCARQASHASDVLVQAPLTHDQLFDLVSQQLAQQIFPGVSLSPERQREVDGFLMRHRIRPPRR